MLYKQNCRGKKMFYPYNKICLNTQSKNPSALRRLKRILRLRRSQHYTRNAGASSR
jgi:hypothetical protein